MWIGSASMSRGEWIEPVVSASAGVLRAALTVLLIASWRKVAAEGAECKQCDPRQHLEYGQPESRGEGYDPGTALDQQMQPAQRDDESGFAHAEPTGRKHR